MRVPFMKRGALALLFALLRLPAGLAQPSLLPASSSTYDVPPPSGYDDTAAIQTALDACTAHGPSCSVQLAAGTYHTRQLVAYNFHGTFRGQGRDQTTIEAISNLPVTVKDVFVENSCLPDTTSCLWPSLIIFVEGDIHIADLSIKIAATDGQTTGGWTSNGLHVTGLVDALRVMGQHPTNVTVDRVAIQGSPDSSPNSFGFNVINGILYAGELPRSTALFDEYFLSGHLTVRDCSFSAMVDGVGQDGFFKDSRVIIGGTPSSGNHFENVVIGIWIESAQNSVFDVSYNHSSGLIGGMRIDPWLPVAGFVPDKASLYLIHDNHFIATAPFGEGLHLENPPDSPWIHALVFDNTIASSETLIAGIGAVNTQKTAFVGNKISGTGATAIVLSGGAMDSVIRNDVRGFDVVQLFPPPPLAQIYLDPQTQSDLVICARSTDTLLDQGTTNKAVGCQLQ